MDYYTYYFYIRVTILYNGSYLVGKTAIKITYQPSSDIMKKFNRIKNIVIDNDGIEVLITPCKNNMKLIVNQSTLDKRGESNKYMLFYNDKMDKDEAILIKINIEKFDTISFSYGKVKKFFTSKIEKCGENDIIENYSVYKRFE